MAGWPLARKKMLRWGLPLMVLAWCADSSALIAGRDAESNAARLEKQGKFREAAVWRLVAARGYRELIIPFEVESVRAYSQWGNARLAGICAKRAEVLYPKKIRENLQLYEHDCRKAGGARVRDQIEQEAVEMLSKFAPVPLAVPSRLSGVEESEKRGDWRTAADHREVSARIFLFVTVAFFERESDRAKGNERRKRLQAESLKYLKLARRNFTLAAENYRRAAQQCSLETDSKAVQLSGFCRRKAAEMEAEAQSLSFRIESRRP